LRHAYATHLVEAGVELTEVQQILGHHSILTTVRYTHLTDQTRHHAIDRINGLMDRYSLSKRVSR
jgi:site-specific recombinase XerD